MKKEKQSWVVCYWGAPGPCSLRPGGHPEPCPRGEAQTAAGARGPRGPLPLGLWARPGRSLGSRHSAGSLRALSWKSSSPAPAEGLAEPQQVPAILTFSES